MSQTGNTPPAYDGPPGMPRWLKVGLVVAALVAAALLVVALAVPAGHGPGRH